MISADWYYVNLDLRIVRLLIDGLSFQMRDQQGRRSVSFEILPRRWIVERTFAWLGRSRRLAKDWKRDWTSAIAWLFIAHIRIAMRRMARP